MADSRGPVTLLDLKFKVEGTIGAFLVRTAAGPVLVECGPESLYGNLEAAVEAEGFALKEVRHVFLTHVHLDHGGSAWRLARHGARVYVHPEGARHLVAPERLMASAKRVYGELLDPLWGRMEAVPEAQVSVMGDFETVRLGGVDFQALHTPGHAVHHITFRVEDGLFTGDVGGVRIGQGPVIPPFPPPDVDLEAWAASIVRMRAVRPGAIYPTHFGIKRDAAAHLDSLEANLARIPGWVRDRLGEEAADGDLVPAFQAYLNELLEEGGVNAEDRADYETADPAFMSVHGLARYWRKQAQS